LNEDIIEDGIWIGCGDLVWRTWRVIADYDGDHHDESGQRHQDAQTRDDYVATGWRHIAVTKKMSDHEAVDRIERALRERGWRP
jgi:very-short-patch-repair endonuclease